MAKNGRRKCLSQGTGRSSCAVKEGEQSPFGASQLLFVLEKVPWREAIDILGYYCLRKTIVKETQRMVNDQVVHLVLQQPKGIEYGGRQCVMLGDRPHYRLSGHDYRPLQEEGAASGDALDRVEINRTREKKSISAMVSTVNHGIDLVGINAVPRQCFRDLSSQRRFSANDLKAGLMVRDPETALEDRLQRVGERSMTDIM